MSLYLDIKRSFPDFTLDVQLEGARETLALLGASGCGKSLILKCIAGIEKPDSGRIAINGQVVFDSSKKINLPPQKRNVGFLFQNYALFPTKTVWGNIACVIKKPKSEKHAIVKDIIQKFQLEKVQDLYPRHISGGQQQRTALARILVTSPQILMLDEPFSALDTQLKWRMEQEVSAVLAEFGGMTVLVSHDRDEVYRLSDKIAVMDGGRVDSLGTKADIFDNPKTLAAARMTGCKNISHVKKVDDFTVNALDWGIVLKTSQKITDKIKYIGVRGHHFEAGGEGDNHFACQIHGVIEEPFEKILEFSFEENSGRLHLITAKQTAENLSTVSVCPDKILCLE